ncbi:hypothetical protein EXIGLDRAFT_784546 [Exidia glandulosa HHB12029]|uniref:CCHC-type domain-containing protein n=1 Tax=Exidia glandulosa HHB12029 TaxID=1314781 RepID=A0A166ME97_EXIGL|nr:hypothetical protein EXIGLDRAFT_784546 [Exidia glandulosa HHB12029]
MPNYTDDDEDAWATDDGAPIAPLGAAGLVGGGTALPNPPPALTTLRSLVVTTNQKKRLPGWWRTLWPQLIECINELEDEIGDLRARISEGPQAAAAGQIPLSTTLADLKEQNAQVIDALAQLAPTARHPRDSIVLPAPGPQFRQPAFCIVLSLAAVPAGAPLLTLTPADIKASIDSALRTSTVPALSGTSTHSVRRERQKLFVHATSAEHKAALVRFSDEWLIALGPGIKLAVRRVSLQLDLVSTKFDPNSPAALDALHLSNPTTILSRSHLQDVRWLHETKAGKSGRSSLVIIVSDFDTGRGILRDGLCILGEYCPANILPPVVHQCYRCQGFGHQSSQCLKQQQPRPLACGRCASPDHATSGCKCPARPTCIAMRRCTHVILRCANCKGAHKAFDANCPVKAAALKQATQSTSYLALWQELTHRSP